MSYPKLIPCSVCGKYPDLLKVQDKYKYVDDISCKNEVGTAGHWHRTKAGAIRAWNRRAKGGWENYA